MAATRAARPNQALRALIKQHPALFQPMLEENSAAMIRFMNEWADLHAKNPVSAYSFVDKHIRAKRAAT